jgi:hypothetical protein
MSNDMCMSPEADKQACVYAVWAETKRNADNKEDGYGAFFQYLERHAAQTAQFLS